MKPTLLDRVIGFFSPKVQAQRVHSRIKTDIMLRSYDAANTFLTDDWSSAKDSTSANAETRGAVGPIRSKARDAVRNNAHATKALNVIVSNTVGSGIMPNIRGKTKLQTKRIKEAWSEWGESTLCDSNEKLNFYGLQSLVMSAVPESGEIIGLKEINADKKYSIKILESDYVADSTIQGNDGSSTIQGVKVNSRSVVQSYFLYENHPGEASGSIKVVEHPIENLMPVYRQQRPGQLRGVSWFHSVIRPLEDLTQFEQATLISKKIQACFSVFIKSAESDSTLSAADLQKKRQNENMLEPGSIRYLASGEEAQMVAPAATQDYDPFTRAQLRKIASGLGITYEAFTSDYSQVNFSSGRMGHLEFRKNVDMWRWNMLIPQFCEPSFQHFLKWCREVKGLPTDGITCQWVPPCWSMIDPEKEVNAIRSQIRAGLTSYNIAVREQGYEPEQLIEEISETNKLLDQNKIVLDSDPRRTTQAGIFQIEPMQQGNTPNESNNEKVSTNGTPTKSN